MNTLRELLAWVRSSWEELALASINGERETRRPMDATRFQRIADHFGAFSEYHECVDDDFWHHVDCTWQCAHCDERFSDDATYIIMDGELCCPRWCKSCFDDHGRSCSCGCRSAHEDNDNWEWLSDTEEYVWGPRHETYHCEASGDTYSSPCDCNHCCDDNDDDSCDVPAYHSQARHKCRDSVERFGVELETFCADAYEVYAKLPTGFIGERDGSLCSTHGLEIVGPPLTLADYPNSAWKNIVKLPSRAWDAGRGYGMHVSANRASFLDDGHVHRFACLIHDNKNFCERIAGRKENDWARYHPRLTLENDSKYSAVNVQSHRCEVRIFRATLKWSTFLKNVEFVAACQRFTRHSEPLLSNFLDWLLGAGCFDLIRSAQALTYPNLHAFLANKKLYEIFGKREELRQCA